MSLFALKDCCLTTVAAGLCCYLFFKRWEPTSPRLHFVFLVFVPCLLDLALRDRFSSFLRAALFIHTIYLSTVLGSVALYRLSSYHPLASYPGPTMCKLTKFWMAWMSSDGKQHLYVQSLHNEYGDIVRIGPNEVSIRDVNAINSLVGTAGCPKGPHWDGRMAEQKDTRALIGIRDNAEHTRRRRPWKRAFDTTALADYGIIMERRLRQLLSSFERRKQPVDMAERLSCFTFDFMSDMAFGGGSEMIRDGDVDNTWKLFDSGLPLALVLSHVPWLGQYYVMLPRVGHALKKFRTFCQDRARLRQKEGSQVKDLFHYLIDEAGVESTPPTFAEVMADGVLAIVAGADTTATVLSSLFWALSTHPEAYHQLQAEVDRWFPAGSDAWDVGRQAEMPYLNAVINEALRLYPAVMGGSQRGVVDHGGRLVGPYFLPEGTSALIHFYSMHRDPRYFSPKPDAFWPERWLTPEQRSALPSPSGAKCLDKYGYVHNTSAFLPFSYGPMNCVGKRLAYHEMRAVVTMLVQRFDFRLADGYSPDTWEHDLKDYWVATRGELPMALSPRESFRGV
ncbi:high nitrogen upregulated cytochrome P450 monooxygenase 2 [Coniophora puteana RWD-64-598 SS2]|uniref:High nitrogen upregulated cytochrome P450 monooxygenase 2 n=1 Tax=Coniophora puteana (strain RWD-64-598) TaxID=741705 RepID=A0A5M3MXV5_CONPW|nr:high nitrogen upregulated cytochrome P450 monooxygenase 2 [Coniophora puteana RWD-64-598 SS2]EIW84003.1 high nitrogen upregulated cytochrome P450 monooxygenase 2 [Coniophora puteana RWD-64-598 SS2]